MTEEEIDIYDTDLNFEDEEVTDKTVDDDEELLYGGLDEELATLTAQSKDENKSSSGDTGGSGEDESLELNLYSVKQSAPSGVEHSKDKPTENTAPTEAARPVAVPQPVARPVYEQAQPRPGVLPTPQMPGLIPTPSHLEEQNTVYIGNLTWWTTDQEIEDIASEFGKVKSVKFFENKANGKSKGYAFVEFFDPAAARACKEKVPERAIHDREVISNFVSQQTLHELSASARGIKPTSTRGRGAGWGDRGRGESRGRGGRGGFPGGRGFPGASGFDAPFPGDGGPGSGGGPMGEGPDGPAFDHPYEPPYDTPPVILPHHLGGPMPPYMRGGGFPGRFMGRGGRGGMPGRGVLIPGRGGFRGGLIPGPVPGVAPHFNPVFFKDQIEDMYRRDSHGDYDDKRSRDREYDDEHKERRHHDEDRSDRHHGRSEKSSSSDRKRGRDESSSDKSSSSSHRKTDDRHDRKRHHSESGGSSSSRSSSSSSSSSKRSDHSGKH